MGNLWTRFKHKDARIILLGLDSAGKTSILYRLKLDDLITTIPTIGFNVESINYKDMHLTAWDIGSRDKIRPLFRHYYKGADAVVFVIDSHDPERLDELNYDVIKPAISAEELTNAVFLFLANKMDLSNTMSTDDIAEKLGLRFLKHPWGILPVSAVSGEGLQSALDWLAVRLGSSVVKPRNFAQLQPQPVAKTSCPRSPSPATSSPANSSPATSRTNSSRAGDSKPIIMVNSRLYMDSRASPSSSPSLDRSSMSISPNPLISQSKRSSSNFVNSFSSYSMAHSLREDQAKRTLSNVSLSRADLRRLSTVSLNEPKNLSSVSLEDSPPQETLPATTVNLLVTPNTTSSPSPKQPNQDLSLSGFGNFSPIMADYVQSSRKDLDSSAKDSSSSTDSIPVSSPSELIQPHLRTLGIKKPSFLSTSGKYVVNPGQHRNSPPQHRNTPPQHRNSPPHFIRNLNQMQQNFNSSPESNSETPSDGGPGSLSSPQSPPLRPQCLPNERLTQTNVNILSHGPASAPATRKRSRIYSKSGKQSSEDSSNSSSSSPSTSNRRSTLDLFCTPNRRSVASFSPTSVEGSGNESMAVIPASVSRGISCSRAYSAMKCLFFRPTKEEMQEETNSISSDDEPDPNEIGAAEVHRTIHSPTSNHSVGGGGTSNVCGSKIMIAAGGSGQPVML